MFQGAAALNLDAKGRLAVPSRHRERLAAEGGDGLVITVHPHGCLLVYPVAAWEPIREKVLAAPSLDAQAALLKRMLVGFAREESIDSTGRVLIAPELRRFAGLDKQVHLVGQGSHFELWSDAGWQQQQQRMLALATQTLPPGFEDLAL